MKSPSGSGQSPSGSGDPLAALPGFGSSSRTRFGRDPFLFCAGLGSLGALSAWVGLAPLVVATVWLVTRRWSLATSILALALCAISWQRAHQRIEDFEANWESTRASLQGPRRCAFTGVVVSSPVAHRGFTEEEGLSFSWSLEVAQGECEGEPFVPRGSVRLSGERSDLARGDRVEVIAQVAASRRFRNAGVMSPEPAAARHGTVASGTALVTHIRAPGRSLRASIDRVRSAVRVRILATFPPSTAPLARALVLGESDLDPESAQAFRDSGLLHLLAVSGTHLVIAVLALVQALRALLVRLTMLSARFDVARWSAALGVSLSFIYADLSGGSGSAWRAAWMLALVLGARVLGRHLSGVAALGGSLAWGILSDPLWAFDLSFLLSALATGGLIGLGQPLSRFLAARLPRLLHPVAVSLAATFSSSVACAPVLALMNDRMTLAALLANVVAAPIGELVALPACLVHTLTAGAPPLEYGLAQLGSGALGLVALVARWSAAREELAFSVALPGVWQLTLLATVALLADQLAQAKAQLQSQGILPGVGSLGLARSRLRVGLPLGMGLLAAVCAGVVVLPAQRGPAAGLAPPSGRPLFAMTALDVGQGDALLLDLPDGRLILVDGGGFVTEQPDLAQRVLLPQLRARDRDRVDLMIVSHAHPDHIGGLLGVAGELPVSELWHPEEPLETPSLRRLVQRVRVSGGLVRGPQDLCGLDRSQSFSSERGGRVELEVLGPCEPARAASSCAQDQDPTCQLEPPWGRNDASLVVRVSYGARRFLLTGDVERLGEEALVRSERPRLRADVLKVAHHGSDTSSSPALLEATGARLSLISSGVRNRFDHPRRVTLERLHAQGMQVLRTDLLGSISVLSDGQDLWVRSAPLSPRGWLPPRVPPRVAQASAAATAAGRDW